MDFFTKLEHLTSSQSPEGASTAEVLAATGSPTVLNALLDHGTITSKCISAIGGDSETLFQACSVSKPITGMATMRLIQAGKLSLDSKIVDLLPKHVIQIVETPQTKDLLKEETVRHLMSHTSGLSVGGFQGYPKDAPDAETLEGIPGYAFSYSGGGMTVLQIILETVTGKDFPSLMQELVFDPLEMKRSCYVLADGEKNLARAYSTGYTPCNVQWHTQPEKAAAGLWTTPSDLLKAVRAMQKSLKGGDGEVFLGKEMAREMLEEVENTMALTWIAPRDGIAFGHGGLDFPGWECFVMGYADLKIGKDGEGIKDKNAWVECGISIMTNSASGFTVWAKVCHAIGYLKKWTPIPCFDGRTADGTVPFCDYGFKVDQRWIEWKGSWAEGEKRLVLEASEGGVPVLRFGKTAKAKLLMAAISSIEYEEGLGNSIDLVLEGLEMMVKLGWKDGTRSVELWKDGVPPRMTHLTRDDA